MSPSKEGFPVSEGPGTEGPRNDAESSRQAETAIDPEEQRGIMSFLQYLQDDELDEKRGLVREMVTSGEVPADLDDDIYRCSIYSPEARRALLEALDRRAEEADRESRERVEAIFEEVTERTKNDYLAYLESPDSLRRDDPGLYDLLEPKLRHLSETERGNLARRLLK